MLKSESAKYQLGRGVRLLYASWQDEDASVVLNIDPGDTLLVTKEAATALQVLQKGALSGSELVDCILENTGDRTGLAPDRNSMYQLLASLNHQGLVERADV